VQSVSIRAVASPSFSSASNGHVWWIKVLLRVMGTVTAMAFLATVMPAEWMAAVHERLGLGAFPRSPVVDYLARSIAGLYGFHGVLLLLVSSDPVRYRAIVNYIGILNVTFGAMLIGIDLFASMPWWWTAWEGPSIIPFGILLLLLNRSKVRSVQH
jgi:hypothetical protein